MEEIIKIIREFPYNCERADSRKIWQEELTKIISFFGAQWAHSEPFPTGGERSGICIGLKGDTSMAFYNNFTFLGHSQEFSKICLVVYEGNRTYWHRCVVDCSNKEQVDERLKLIVSDAEAYSKGGGLVKDFQEAETNFDVKSIFSQAENYRRFSLTDKISTLGVVTYEPIWEIIHNMGRSKTKGKKEGEPTIADLLKANPENNNDLLPFDKLSFLEKNNPNLIPSLKKLHKLRERLIAAYYVPQDGPFLFYGSKEYWVKKVKERGISPTEANTAVNVAKKMGWIKVL